MATSYKGNPVATESPSPQPMPGEVPVATLPADGDALDAASVAQMVKVNTDIAATYLQPGRIRVFQDALGGALGVYTSSAAIDGSPQLYMSINGAGSSVEVRNPGASSFCGKFLTLTAGGASGRYANVGATLWNYNSALTNFQLSIENEISISDVTIGDYRIGIVDSVTTLASFAGLRHLHTDTDWILVTSAGTFTVPSSAPVNNAHQAFRIVYSGTATPAGVANSNTALIKVFLNDATTPALTQSGNFIASGLVFPIQDARASGAGGALASLAAPCWSWNSR